MGRRKGSSEPTSEGSDGGEKFSRSLILDVYRSRIQLKYVLRLHHWLVVLEEQLEAGVLDRMPHHEPAVSPHLAAGGTVAVHVDHHLDSRVSPDPSGIRQHVAGEPVHHQDLGWQRLLLNDPGQDIDR